ncbi:vWA domain-containing protein [Mariprofundus ferrooxydans]|uniref:BatB protein, putative n=1 Tax=Mariprofundus ferrooxydans PV-1 TaxID=314345 RepID=Q0EXM9_9PROT|nr:VWA domain-containing protein [Mariprofundus ferrooxydans]EAU54018.1 batB protein, putative [Mariprofundus ferrooxydans PV-1]
MSRLAEGTAMSAFSFAGFELAWPWVLALLPLPWLVRRLLPAVQQTRAVAWIPFAAEFSALPHASTSTVSRQERIRMLLAALVWVLLLFAAARPAWYDDAVALPVSGRDLLLAVDISGSMQIKDFEMNGQQVSRLTATKAVARQFISRRVGDRVGLILFGSNAYVQTPLTFDRKTVITLLDEAAVGLAGKATAIGDAIGLAVKRLEQSNRDKRIASKEQVLILLTDGVNTAGQLSAPQAAELAAEHGLTIYTIGIGADAMTVQSFFGTQRVNPSADLDEKMLTDIATKTGGRYFRAHDTQELQKIYAMIDKLEPVARDRVVFRPRHSLFVWPLGLALLLGCALMLSMTEWRHVWKR